MKATKLYRYIGLNGTFTTGIILDCPNKIEFYALSAEPGKLLTNGVVTTRYVEIPIEEINEWFEIEDKPDN